MQSHMRLFLALAGIVSLTCVGCATPERAGPPLAYSFPTADMAQFTTLWEDCQDVLRDYRFKIDRLDRRSGLIATAPLTSAHFFEPWRHDTVTPYDFWEASLTTVRRSVTINAVYQDNQGETEVTLTVNRERFARPERQFNHTMAAFRMFGDSLPAEATGRPVSTADDYWISAGRDLALERRLLGAIINRTSG